MFHRFIGLQLLPEAGKLGATIIYNSPELPVPYSAARPQSEVDRVAGTVHPPKGHRDDDLAWLPGRLSFIPMLLRDRSSRCSYGIVHPDSFTGQRDVSQRHELIPPLQISRIVLPFYLIFHQFREVQRARYELPGHLPDRLD
jgi:hypothetical protein